MASAAEFAAGRSGENDARRTGAGDSSGKDFRLSPGTRLPAVPSLQADPGPFTTGKRKVPPPQALPESVVADNAVSSVAQAAGGSARESKTGGKVSGPTELRGNVPEEIHSPREPRVGAEPAESEIWTTKREMSEVIDALFRDVTDEGVATTHRTEQNYRQLFGLRHTPLAEDATVMDIGSGDATIDEHELGLQPGNFRRTDLFPAEGVSYANVTLLSDPDNSVDETWASFSLRHLDQHLPTSVTTKITKAAEASGTDTPLKNLQDNFNNFLGLKGMLEMLRVSRSRVRIASFVEDFNNSPAVQTLLKGLIKDLPGIKFVPNDVPEYNNAQRRVQNVFLEKGAEYDQSKVDAFIEAEYKRLIPQEVSNALRMLDRAAVEAAQKTEEERESTTPDVRIPHFQPVETDDATQSPKDKFGNTVIEKPFIAEDGDEATEAYLVSANGQDLLRDFPDLPSSIDQGIELLQALSGKHAVSEIGLGEGMKIRTHNNELGGGQSQTYVLEIGDKKYLISKRHPEGKYHQPYSNEMLQAQMLAADNKEALDAANMTMGSYLFASSEMMCTEFEEGMPPRFELGIYERFLDQYEKVQHVINKYIATQQSPLWENVYPDWKVNNFIYRPRDGKYVFVDPFLYERRETGKADAGEKNVLTTGAEPTLGTERIAEVLYPLAPAPNTQRWEPDAIHINTKAPLRHFETVEEAAQILRDRFGNRIYPSSDKAYKDRDNRETKAAMLISREGEDFFAAHPEILAVIDQGMQQLTDKRHVEINGIRITQLPRNGSQSITYILGIGSEKYIIKKHAQPKPPHEDKSQPYINEMLQSQAMATDLKDLLAEANIEMPTFLFATGQISCVKFVNGPYATRDDVNEHLAGIKPLLRAYIAEKSLDNTLWNKIAIDPKPVNFIKSGDKLVWIDPFFYDPLFDMDNFMTS